METKLLELTFYSGHDYPALVADLVSQYAQRSVGISAEDQQAVSTAVESAYQFLLQNSTWYHESLEIRCELISSPSVITVRFSDRAYPWQRQFLNCNIAPNLKPVSLPDATLEASNKGLDGRELYLSIPIKSGGIKQGSPQTLPVAKQSEITYRLLQPHEAYEMGNCMYTAYGYTYGAADAYSHDDTSALMKSGEIVILAAETEDGQIAGVSTLRKRAPKSTVFDLCQTAVKPEFRGNRIFENLLSGVMTTAEADLQAQGLSATIPNRHLVSQDRMETAGFTPMGIFLGMAEAKYLPPQIGPFAHERESFLSVYKPLQEPNFGPLYVPPFHLPTISHLCAETGIESPIRPVEPINAGKGKTSISAGGSEHVKSASIEVLSAGDDVVDQVFNALTDFKQRHFAAICLYLDMRDPIAMACCERFEAMGFFYATFFPDEKPFLVLQYLNDLPVLFHELLYPFTGAKQVQYHIERAYRRVKMREKGELIQLSDTASLPNVVPLPDGRTI